MSWDYSEKIQELFMNAIANPQQSHIGEMENPDGRGRHGSISCGDAIVFYFKVKKDKNDPLKDKIIETKYKTFGCTSAIASSEALCIILEAKKMTPLEALKITNQDIVDFLGGMPQQKIHCSVMGTEVLREAVSDWALRRGVGLEKLGNIYGLEEQDEGRITCECFSLTKPYIKRKIRELNLRTVEDIQNTIKAGAACTTCINMPDGLNDILKEVWPGSLDLNNNEKMFEKISMDMEKKVRAVIEETIKPALGCHLAALDVVDIKGSKVYLQIEKACGQCEEAETTLKNTIEKYLMDLVDKNIQVIDV